MASSQKREASISAVIGTLGEQCQGHPWDAAEKHILEADKKFEKTFWFIPRQKAFHCRRGRKNIIKCVSQMFSGLFVVWEGDATLLHAARRLALGAVCICCNCWEGRLVFELACSL